MSAEESPPPLPNEGAGKVSLAKPRLLKRRRIVRKKAGIEPEAIRCTECGAPLEVQHTAMAQTISCGSCGSVLDLRDPERKVLRKILTGHDRPRSTLPLGAKGGLSGVNWTVIGRIRLQDAEGWRWNEYLLFSPKTGYAWLEEDEGKWSLERKAKNKPEFDPKTASLGERFSHLGDTYEVKEFGAGTITFIEGEFPYHAQKDDVIQTLDAAAISSRSKISASWTKTELEWLTGKSLSGWTVQRAFGTLPLDTTATNTTPAQRNMVGVILFLVFFALPVCFILFFCFIGMMRSGSSGYSSGGSYSSGSSSYRSSRSSSSWGK